MAPSPDQRRRKRGPRRLFGVICVCAGLLGLIMGCHTDQSGRRPESTPPVAAVAPPPPQATTPTAIPAEQPPPPVTWKDFDRAISLYTDGHFHEARLLLARIYKIRLTARQNKALRFLAGLTAYRLGLVEETEQYLAGEGNVSPTLVGYALYLRGMARFGAGQYQAARELLARFMTLHPDSPWTRRAELTSVQALAYLNRPGEALEECRPLLKTDKSGRAALLMARLYEGMGRPRTARSYYKQAMDSSRQREVRAEAAHKYRLLLMRVVDQAGHEEEKLELVAFLRREWRLDEALALIERLRAGGGSENFLCRLNSHKARLLFYSGRITRAMGFYRGGGDSSAWMYARCLKRLGRWDEAARSYLKLAGYAPARSKKADQGYLEAGLILLHLNKKEQADQAWEKISERSRKGRYADDLLWHEGFYHFRHKDWKEAAERFKTLEEKHPKSRWAQGAPYWLARTYEKSGQKVEASKIYRVLAAKRTNDYYRMMAEHRLGWVRKNDHWPDLPVFQKLLAMTLPHADASVLPMRYHIVDSAGKRQWSTLDPALSLGSILTERKRLAALTPPGPEKSPLHRSIARLRDLAFAGAMDMAYDETVLIRALMKKERGTAHLNRRLFAFQSAYQAEVGDYDDWVRLQYRNYRTLLSGRSEKEKTRARRRFYPLAYPGAILKASGEYHLHPALLLAVMRTESYYHPHILSVANARGLMQLLPSTAEKIMGRRGRPAPHWEALFAPEVNISLGAWYLAALVKEFDGQYPLAIASYNAGPFNVKRWVKQAGECTLEEFIETIPFDQTRLYVKKILGIMYQYRLLYAGEAIGPNLDVPLRQLARNTINF